MAIWSNGHIEVHVTSQELMDTFTKTALFSRTCALVNIELHMHYAISNLTATKGPLTLIIATLILISSLGITANCVTG